MPQSILIWVIGLLSGLVVLLLGYLYKLHTAKDQYEKEVALLNQELKYKTDLYNQLKVEEAGQRSLLDAATTAINDLTARCSVAETRLVSQDKLEQQLLEKEQQLAQAGKQMAEMETRLQDEQKAVAEKLELLTAARESMLVSFKALSADALQASNQSFLELAKTTLEGYQKGAQSDLAGRQQAINDLVTPLKDTLQKAEAQVRELEKERQSAYTELRTQVEMLTTGQQGLQKETANLVQALRLPHVRGRWGEIQLQRVVELAGMTPHCDFVEQESVGAGRLRPDMIINLPGGRRVPVDAKAPLIAYLNAMEAGDEREKIRLLQDHVRQIRLHINKLAAKSYWEALDYAPEFVVLFLPGEVFFAAALEQEAGLIEYGVEQKVILATPTTLIALLKGVAYGWRQEQLARNAREICEVGKTLYDRVRILTNHFNDLGRSLDKSVDSYNRTIGSLERNVLSSARRIKDLGAGSEADIVMLEPIDKNIRHLQAPEMLPNKADENGDGINGEYGKEQGRI
ncbi:MAG: DNA recombination protein RmuC [Methylocystaceae bacterium]